MGLFCEFTDLLLLQSRLISPSQTDDRTDEGMLQSRPDDLELGAKHMMDVVKNPLGPVPRFSNARMLQE